MKKLILATILTMFSLQVYAEVQEKPTRVLKAKAYVYKFKDVEKKDGTTEMVSTEVCKKDIELPSFKGNSNDNVSFGLDKFFGYCYGKILDQDVTIVFGSLHHDVLIQPGAISTEYGLNSWINSRANMVIGMTTVIPGKVKPVFDETNNVMTWDSKDNDYSQLAKLQDIIPTSKSSVSIYRGSVNLGFASFMELDNSEACNKISDRSRQEKCFEDGFFRVNIVYEGKN